VSREERTAGPGALAQAALARSIVTLPGPLDVAASAEVFRRAGDDGIDRWDGTRLVRTLRLADGRVVAYACEPVGTVAAPALAITVGDGRDLPEVARAVRATFFQAPPSYAALLAADPVIAALDARFAGLRQVRQHDLFAALVRCISAQQVNLRWAVTTRRRLAEAFGTRHEVAGAFAYHLDPARLADVPVEAIRALQFTTRKAEYLVLAARAVVEGKLLLEDLEALDDEAAIERITAVRGLGRWTAEWVLARTLGRPRVVAGDLAVRKAIGSAYLGELLPSEVAVRHATAHWGDAAGVAQTLLLAGYGAGTAQTATISV
jgi:DNA-3-methyladenine glycosylase II